MYLIDDMGTDGFRAEVERRYKAATGENIATEGKSMVPAEWKRRAAGGDGGPGPRAGPRARG